MPSAGTEREGHERGLRIKWGAEDVKGLDAGHEAQQTPRGCGMAAKGLRPLSPHQVRGGCSGVGWEGVVQGGLRGWGGRNALAAKKQPLAPPRVRLLLALLAQLALHPLLARLVHKAVEVEEGGGTWYGGIGGGGGGWGELLGIGGREGTGIGIEG